MASRKNIYVYYHKNTGLENKLERLFELALKNDFTIVDEPKDANIIVSVGGDGAFLQAVRKTGFRQDCLYTGITYSDEAGLYCDLDRKSTRLNSSHVAISY